MAAPPIVVAVVASLALSAACAAQSPSRGVDAPPRDSIGREAMQGRVPCESIPLGMGFSYSLIRSGAQPPSLDLSTYPTIGFVCPGSPAERGGLQAGDIVLELNGIDFRERAARDQMRGPAGTQLRYRVRRGHAEHEMIVVVPPRASPAGRSTDP